LIQKAILESSLHELPDFMEPPDTRVGIPFARTGRDEDYRFSQELALQEWTAMQGVQRTSLRGGLSPALRSSQTGNPSDLNRSFSHSLSPALRSGQSGNPIDLSRPLSRGLSQQVEPHNGPRSRLDRSVNVNFIPGRAVAVDVTGRETSIEPRQHISVASTRAAMLMPLVQAPLGTRSRSFEPAVGSTLTGGRSPTLRHNNDQARNQQASPAPRAQQDPRPHGPPGELLRRGNEETRAAIATGRAHVIVCQGCRNRLHAPKNYSLVLCPTCNTISPGLLADGEGDSSASCGGRDQHLNH
jgi:LSD1 subclass zinc finger protein